MSSFLPNRILINLLVASWLLFYNTMVQCMWSANLNHKFTWNNIIELIFSNTIFYLASFPTENALYWKLGQCQKQHHDKFPSHTLHFIDIFFRLDSFENHFYGASFLVFFKDSISLWSEEIIELEIVFTRAAPAFDNLFMGCALNVNTLHKTVLSILLKFTFI